MAWDDEGAGMINRALEGSAQHHPQYRQGGGGGCFSGGTMVTLSNGEKKRIDKIFSGDSVSYIDPKSNVEFEADVICRVNHSPRKLISLTLVDGSDLLLTPNHKLFNRSRWISARKLKVGDTICKYSDGEMSEISISEMIRVDPKPVYNLITSTGMFVAGGFLTNSFTHSIKARTLLANFGIPTYQPNITAGLLKLVRIVTCSKPNVKGLQNVN